MPTITLLPEETRITIAANNDKVLLAGPFVINDELVSRVGKRLRFIMKLLDFDDEDAVIDINSEDDPLKVLGVGDPPEGVWALDLRGILPPPDFYRFRCDIANEADGTVDVETVGLGSIRVKAV